MSEPREPTIAGSLEEAVAQLHKQAKGYPPSRKAPNPTRAMNPNWRRVEQERRSRAEILDLVEKHVNERGIWPTKREVAALAGLSRSLLDRHLRELEQQGSIKVVGGSNPIVRMTV